MSADQRADALSKVAEDLDKVKGAVVDATNMARNIWVLFLSFAFFVAVAVGPVTHRQILLEEPLRLPLFNVDLPLTAYAIVAPVLLIAFHVYLLMHLKLLSDKVRDYDSLVRDLGLERTTENRVRLQLPDFVFLQYLAGPAESWKSLMSFLLVSVAWLTVVFGPVILLLFIQVQFLPYHHEGIIWALRIFIALDIVLLCWFGPRILPVSFVRRWFVFGLLIFAVAMPIAFVIAVSPEEAIYALYGEECERWLDLTRWFPDRLVLSRQSFVKADDLEKITERKERAQKAGETWIPEYTLSLVGRQLECAVLDETDLRHVDLTQAKLKGASLFAAHLEDGLLGNAHLQCANLRSAYLRGVSLVSADLRCADLTGADLRGADLRDADLRGAKLDGPVADLSEGKLLGGDRAGADHRLPSRDCRALCPK
jgi:hypothetical protein